MLNVTIYIIYCPKQPLQKFNFPSGLLNPINNDTKTRNPHQDGSTGILFMEKSCRPMVGVIIFP